MTEKNIQTIEKVSAQGELIMHRVDSIPDGWEPQEVDGDIIVAHSETGHHHVIEHGAVIYESGENPLVAYLEVQMEFVDLIHRRSSDTHAPQRFRRGIWEVRRQREYIPGGGTRRAVD